RHRRRDEETLRNGGAGAFRAGHRRAAVGPRPHRRAAHRPGLGARLRPSDGPGAGRRPMTASFAHPWWLLALLVPIAAAAAYVAVDKRKRRRSIAFGTFTVVADVTGPGHPWLRHVPVAALLAALAVLAVAMAGPMAETKVARNRATIMLAVDVSLSMSATD